MSNELIKYAYISGEISPYLYSRTDLEKYDLGLALARNWFIDYRGGMSTRPGTEFRTWMQFPSRPIRWAKFEFSPNIANTNIVVFGLNYIRFLQEGNYVLEAAKAVASITSGIVSSTAHGYTSGDLVQFTSLTGAEELYGRTFEIVVLSADTFSLKDQFDEAVINTSVFSTGMVSRVYTLVSPYLPEDLAELNFEQIRDVLRLTHYKYKTQDLTRLGAANWTISPTIFDSQVQRPTNISGVPSSVGSAGVCYSVTAVDQNGAESLPSATLVEQATINFTSTAGTYSVRWTPVPGAAYYNVYRSTVSSDGAKASRTQQLGFVGRAYGAEFLDTNVIPDFTRMPPQHNNPFADGTITYIDTGSGGSGYTPASILTITDPTGTGFVGYAVVNNGALVGVVVLNGGENYTAPVASLSGGTGATMTVHVGSSGDNSPAVSSIFQQRQVYAGTLSTPLGLWGSRPKRYSNFDFSPIVVDNDSYDFELDASKVAIIRHLVPMRGGLLVMNNVGVWQLTGGNQGAITPTNALAEPQSYTGVSLLTPLRIETDLLYVEAKGYTVRLMSYNDLAKLYSGQDISILSAHLFGRGQEIISWDFAQEPGKLVHGVREDGRRLIGTLVKDQNLYAWTLASTQGFYRQVISIREDRSDRVYFDVERRIKGKLVRYVELEALRDFDRIEEAWALDSALSLPVGIRGTEITLAANTGEDVTLTSTSSTFTLSDVGSYIFSGPGKLKITAFNSQYSVQVEVIRPINSFIPETEKQAPITDWIIQSPVSFVFGLWHLEGETVSILADGSVMPARQVVNGQIALDTPVACAIIGLSYTAIAHTLPLTAPGAVIEGRRKRVVGAATRTLQSRGLLHGTRLDKLYETKDRTIEDYGQPVLPRSDMRYSAFEPNWDDSGQFYYVVKDPLPVTVLGHVVSIEVGDDPN